MVTPLVLTDKAVMCERTWAATGWRSEEQRVNHKADLSRLSCKPKGAPMRVMSSRTLDTEERMVVAGGALTGALRTNLWSSM